MNKDLQREMVEGPDATLDVGRWVRRLAGEELAQGGSFAATTGDKDHGALPAFTGFSRDVFASLYGLGIKPSGTPAAGSEWISKVLDTAAQLPEWQALQARAAGDPWRCGLAAGEAIGALDNVLNDLASKMPDDVSKAEAEAEQAEADAALPDASEQDQQAAQVLRSLADALAAEADKVAGEVLGAGQGEAKIRKALRTAAALGEKACDEVDAAMGGLGHGRGAGALSAVKAPVEQVRAALRSDARLARIAAVAGRVRASAKKAQQGKRVVGGREEIADVETGCDVQRLLPSESVLLADPDLENLLLRKLVEGQAMQYRLQGRERAERGPMMVLIDGSGSMDGECHEWACGVALALMEVAAKQKRGFAVMHFDDGVRATFDFPKPRAAKLEDVVQAVSYFSGGGTNIQVALLAAGERIKSGSIAMRDSDVVLIGDGESGFFGDEVATLKAKGIAVYGVAIGRDWSTRNREVLAGYESVTQEQISGAAEGAMTKVLAL